MHLPSDSGQRLRLHININCFVLHSGVTLALPHHCAINFEPCLTTPEPLPVPIEKLVMQEQTFCDITLWLQCKAVAPLLAAAVHADWTSPKYTYIRKCSIRTYIYIYTYNIIYIATSVVTVEHAIPSQTQVREACVWLGPMQHVTLGV